MTDHDSNDGQSEGTESRLPWLLLILVSLVLLIVFAGRFVLVPLALSRLLLPALLAVAAAAGISGTGAWSRRLANRVIGGGTPSTAPGAQFDFLIGYPIFGTLFFLLGLITTSLVAMTVLLVILIIASAPVLRFNRTVRRSASLETWIAIISVGLLVMAGAMALLSAQLPASTLDELAYHLAVPKIWITEGHVLALPLLSHSWFPLGIESADLPLLSILGNDGTIASHFLHLFAALATSTVLWNWVAGRSGSRAAWIAVVAVTTTPALLLTAGWSWNEWPLLGIAMALIVAVDRLAAGDEGWVGTVAVAIAAGLLTKYTFGPILLVVLASALWSAAERRTGIVRATIGGMVLGCVFFLRNLIAVGNPVAPFFSSTAPDVSNFRRAGGTAASITNYIFDGRVVDESLGISMLVLAVAFWLFWRALDEERFLRGLGVLMSVLTVALLFLFPTSRILVPSLAVLAGVGAIAWDRRCIAGWNAATSVVLGVACAIQLFLCANFIAGLDPFALLGGRQSESEYLDAHRSSYASADWVNRQVPVDSRTLVVGMNELFWFDRPVRGGGNFDGPRIDRYLGEGMSGDLLARLRRDGITHVAVFPARVAAHAAGALRAERETTLSAAATGNLATVLSGSSVIGENAQGRLYALPPP